MTRHVLPAALAALLAPLAAWGQAPDPVAAPSPDVSPAPAVAAPSPEASPAAVAAPSPDVSPAPAVAARPPRPPPRSGAEGPYLVVRGGVATTRGDRSGPDNRDVAGPGRWEMEDTFDLELGVGTRIARLLTGELSVGGRRVLGTRRGFNGVDDVTESLSGNVKYATASLRLFAPLRGRFRLYGVVGGSAYRVDLRHDETWRFGGRRPTTIASDNPFGLNLGVGFGWALTQRARLDVEAKAAPMSALFGDERIALGGGRIGAGVQLEL